MSRDPAVALIVVDVQNDFCPGGALGRGRRRPTGRAHRRGRAGAGSLVATRDRHPPDHCSFADQGGPWPAHCVAGTDGAELHPSMAEMAFDRVQDKGRQRDREQYSGFDGTDLAEWLRDRGVQRVLVAGLATDYCVRATALDAIAAGFETTVLTDAVAAVDVNPGDGERALAEVSAAGGTLDRVHLMRGPEQLEPLLDAKLAALRAVLEGAQRGKLVLGLSGGIDSAVAWRWPPARSAPSTLWPCGCRRGTPSRCTWTTPPSRPRPPACRPRTC